jgi:hypothetical protein
MIKDPDNLTADVVENYKDIIKPSPLKTFALVHNYKNGISVYLIKTNSPVIGDETIQTPDLPLWLQEAIEHFNIDFDPEDEWIDITEINENETLTI